jgi:mono/diheme cytochrome c family protein
MQKLGEWALPNFTGPEGGRMSRLSYLAIGILLALVLAASTFVPATAQSDQTANEKQLVRRGKYLVERVVICADCHSPRNERGEFIRDRWLGGSPLFFKPTVPIPDWTDMAVPIAGLPGWNEADAIKFFVSGAVAGGKPARPPMPAFRLRPRDAAAVTAYLKSLPPAK